MRSTLFHLFLVLGMCASAVLGQDRSTPGTELGRATVSQMLKAAETAEGSQSANQAGNAGPLPQTSPPQTPQSAPEMQSLAKALVGRWSITEKYEPDEWTPSGGAGQGEEVWRSGPGEFTLMEEIHDHTPTGEEFGVGFTWWDRTKGFQGLWCINTNPQGCDLQGTLAGFAPKWNGKQLVIDMEFPRNGKKFAWHEVFSDITPTSFMQTADIGEVGGPLKRWLTIHATKATEDAMESSKTVRGEDISKVVFVPVRQLDTEIHKAPESGPGVSFIDLIEYTPKGGAGVTRRTRPGRADVHKQLTDMWYVIEGGGTLVTGGSLLEPTQTETDEFRGRGITGGEERQIGKGDFVKIPTGVPHWVQKIDGKELVYLVVKVASPESMKPEEASSGEAELRAAMAECRKASLEGDTEKVASCLADEYRQTDISGYVQDKTTWLNEYFKPLAGLIRAGKFRWEVYERKDAQVRMYGECAVVIGALDLKGSGARPTPQHAWVADPNATFSGTLRFTHVYIKRNGKWLLAALHNQLPPPPPTNN